MPGDWNMACDEALGAAVCAGKSLPVVRFFRWEAPTISFGYSQQIADEVDVAAVRADGVGLVRRVTGGRAVLHADEITYSIICAEDDPVAAGGIIATYTRISTGLAAGLRRLGVAAEMARSSEPLSGPRTDQATVPCFGSTSRAELVVNGRKLVGSAQHRMRGLVLQHGSILLGPYHQRVVRYLQVDDAVRDRYARRLAESTTSLAELGWKGRETTLIESLAAGLAEALGIAWADDPFAAQGLSASEEAEIERLAREKYAAEWWNFSSQCARGMRDERMDR